MGVVKEQLQNATKGAAADAKTDSNLQAPVQGGSYKAPGRLGEPKMEVKDDPRTNARLMPMLQQMGMDRFGSTPGLDKLDENSSIDDIAVMVGAFEDGISQLYFGVPLEIPEDKNETPVQMKEETIKGGDGQDMKVYVYRPENQSGPLPCVVYSHGGGMVLVPTFNPVHDRWCKSIAAKNCVVVMPDFRNAYTKSGYNHYPKGLNDCAAAVKWIVANKDSLKVSKIVLQGESGGGNLACATALKANKEGWIKDIAGVYAVVPYISNAYGWSEERKLKDLPSLVENHGYFLGVHATAFLGHFYAPTDEGYTDPCAWPYHASPEDLKGLPPHVLAMDELDPLRDEGIAYTRKLQQAGVSAKGHVNLGVLHGSSLIFRLPIPEHNKDSVRSIAAFAHDL